MNNELSIGSCVHCTKTFNIFSLRTRFLGSNKFFSTLFEIPLMHDFGFGTFLHITTVNFIDNIFNSVRAASRLAAIGPKFLSGTIFHRQDQDSSVL